MVKFIGLALGAAVAALASGASAQTGSSADPGEREGRGRAAASASAAELAVWDFVHFTTPAELVEVIDAFDDDDPFDFNLSVGYTRTFRRAKIARECREPYDPTSRSGYCAVGRDDGAAADFVDFFDLARYEQTVHTLDFLAVFGLYHDLQFYTRWPLILSDNRSLAALEGGPSLTTANSFLDGLFTLPFTSPERSGIDYFTVGFSWAPFSQQRDPTEPNWVLNFEGRFGIGDILKAARSSGDGGESRGLSEIRFATFLSRRYRYIEPFSGLTFMAGIPKYDAPYHYKDPVSGQINTMPPFEGTMVFGMEIIPWENVERLQKFAIVLDITGTYHSEGRTFTELFDALGTSEDCRLTYDASDPACADASSAAFLAGWHSAYDDREYSFVGMSDAENYATIAGRLTLMVQAAKYIKFSAGIGFGHDTEHFITFTDECNSDASGACEVGGGRYNPFTRKVIDAPGNRFRVQETTVFDLFIDVTAMF